MQTRENVQKKESIEKKEKIGCQDSKNVVAALIKG